MSTPGWYPDPGGRPGHYRLWDGQGWGLSTTPEPPGGPTGGPPPPPRRHVARWVVAGAALLLVLVVVGALALRTGGRPVIGTTPDPAVSSAAEGGPTPTVSSTEPSSSPETPSSAPSTPPATPTAVPSRPTSPSAAADCPVGSPFERQDHPRDGSVHGGGLSFPRQPGWQSPGPQASAFTWAYDLGETDIQLEQTRYASYAVGAVSVTDGFEDPRTAAQLAMGCTAASALYSNVTSRTDLVDQATTVDGHPAWTIRSKIQTYDPRTSYEGDTVQITVVDLDSPEALAFFWGSTPSGDAVFTARLDRVVKQLQVG